MRSSTWPISRRMAESLRLAVSSILPRVVEARLDRVGDAGELADACLHAAEPGELVADPAEPGVEVGDGAQDLDGLGQLLGREHRAGLRAADVGADVVQAAQRRRQPGGEGLGHLGRQGLPVADRAEVASRLHPARRVLAERAGRVGGDEPADLVEIEQFQRVCVHRPPARSDTAGPAEVRERSILARPMPGSPCELKAAAPGWPAINRHSGPGGERPGAGCGRWDRRVVGPRLGHRRCGLARGARPSAGSAEGAGLPGGRVGLWLSLACPGRAGLGLHLDELPPGADLGAEVAAGDRPEGPEGGEADGRVLVVHAVDEARPDADVGRLEVAQAVDGGDPAIGLGVGGHGADQEGRILGPADLAEGGGGPRPDQRLGVVDRLEEGVAGLGPAEGAEGPADDGTRGDRLAFGPSASAITRTASAFWASLS